MHKAIVGGREIEYEVCEPNYEAIYERAKCSADDGMTALADGSSTEYDMRCLINDLNLMVQCTTTIEELVRLREAFFFWRQQVCK